MSIDFKSGSLCFEDIETGEKCELGEISDINMEVSETEYCGFASYPRKSCLSKEQSEVLF